MYCKKLLLAVEEIELAQKTVGRAVSLAKQLNAKLGVINVINSDIFITQESAMILNDLKESMNIKSKSLIKSLKEEFDLENVDIFIEEGNVVDTILNKAKEWKADILVVGTHVRKGIDKWIMGSIEQQLVSHSEIPVLVISKNVK